MAEFFASGRVVDLIIVLMVLEGLALTALWMRHGSGLPPLALWANLAAGGAMLLALRAALTGAGWVWVWLPLAAALLGHLLELRLRWQRRPAAEGADNA